MENKTKEIKRVLAPLDGSQTAECTLNYVRTLAKGFPGLHVELLYVIDAVCLRFNGDIEMSQSACMERLGGVKEWANKYLAEKAEELRRDKISVRFAVREGIPAINIIDYADENKIDLIIMSTHGQSGFARFVLGSVADKVIHYSTVPVLITLPRGCKSREIPAKAII